LPPHRRGATIAVEERRRIALHRAVSRSLGEEAADTLFDLVAPAGEGPATSRDVGELRAEIGALRSEVGTLRSEVGTLRSEVETLDAGLRSEMESMEHRIVATLERRLNETFTAQTRTLVFSQLAALVTIAGLAFGLR
jgi:uncharacterized protein YlxW (UPF0749 family)